MPKDKSRGKDLQKKTQRIKRWIIIWYDEHGFDNKSQHLVVLK